MYGASSSPHRGGNLQAEQTLTDPLSLAVIAAAFAAGGFVKGFAGMGLPLVTVTVLTVAFGLPSAVALMTVSGLVTNVWQSFGGKDTRTAFRRIRPFLVACCLFVWFGTGILVSVDEAALVAVLGAVLAAYALLAVAGWSPTIRARTDRWLGPVLGAVNGVCCGVTGITSVPSVLYVRALALPRETMIQAMGMLFGASYVAIVVSLALRDALRPEVGVLSALALLPALAGMSLGRRLRFRTNDAWFARGFNWLLLAIGCAMIARSF